MSIAQHRAAMPINLEPASAVHQRQHSIVGGSGGCRREMRARASNGDGRGIVGGSNPASTKPAIEQAVNV